jgi:hypothetical protein
MTRVSLEEAPFGTPIALAWAPETKGKTLLESSTPV